jgi:6-phosphogluconolactonase (cycloisomerase 2 family)
MGGNTISAYIIQNDGTLAELANSPFPAGTSPSAIITVKLLVGEFAYVTNMSDNTIGFYSIDSSGNLTPLAALPTGTYPSSVTVDPSGQFVYVTNESSNNISVYTINQNDGTLVAGTAVAAGTSPTSIITVKLSVGEFAYATNTIDGTVWFYSIDSSVNLNYFGQALAGIYPASVTVDKPVDGRFAYVGNMGGNNISVYKINSDGTLILLPSP